MQKIDNLSVLPKEWVITSIHEICDLINGRAFKPSDWKTSGFPIVRIQNLNNLNADFNYCDSDIDEKFHIYTGQLLFGWSGTPGTSFGAHIWNRGHGILNQHIFRVEINEKCINKIFLKYLLNFNIESYVKQAHGSAGLAHITKGKFENSVIPLPPFNEQNRIAAKIEELYTQLDAGVASLKKVQAQLKRYRQAVLKVAFEGRLTQEWREEHKGEIEPVDVMRERIEKIRKTRPKSNFTQSLEEPDQIFTLPQSWTWIHLGFVTESMKNGVYKPPNFYSDRGIGCLRMYNIEKGKIIWKDIKRMTLSNDEINDYLLNEGDFLVNRVNSRELVGKSAVIPNNLERCVYESKNIRLRFFKDIVNSKIVNYWFSLYSQKFFNMNAQQTVGMASINQDQLSKMPFPLSPYIEQLTIIEEIERHFSQIDHLEHTITTSLQQAETIRQSILKRAFEGKLVHQDPNDEPASILLERIKAEKARHATETKKGKTLQPKSPKRKIKNGN